MAETHGKKAIATDAAPAAVGPYSQAVMRDGVLYASGQIPLVPGKGALVEGDFEAQVRQVFANLGAVLAEAGMDFSNVLKVNIYLTDLAQFETLNGIYAEFFEEPYPARATVGVAALPKGAAVEMDLTAA